MMKRSSSTSSITSEESQGPLVISELRPISPIVTSNIRCPPSRTIPSVTSPEPLLVRSEQLDESLGFSQVIEESSKLAAGSSAETEEKLPNTRPVNQFVFNADADFLRDTKSRLQKLLKSVPKFETEEKSIVERSAKDQRPEKSKSDQNKHELEISARIIAEARENLAILTNRKSSSAALAAIGASPKSILKKKVENSTECETDIIDDVRSTVDSTVSKNDGQKAFSTKKICAPAYLKTNSAPAYSAMSVDPIGYSKCDPGGVGSNTLTNGDHFLEDRLKKMMIYDDNDNMGSWNRRVEHLRLFRGHGNSVHQIDTSRSTDSRRNSAGFPGKTPAPPLDMAVVANDIEKQRSQIDVIQKHIDKINREISLVEDYYPKERPKSMETTILDRIGRIDAQLEKMNDVDAGYRDDRHFSERDSNSKQFPTAGSKCVQFRNRSNFDVSRFPSQSVESEPIREVGKSAVVLLRKTAVKNADKTKGFSDRSISRDNILRANLDESATAGKPTFIPNFSDLDIAKAAPIQLPMPIPNITDLNIAAPVQKSTFIPNFTDLHIVKSAPIQKPTFVPNSTDFGYAKSAPVQMLAFVPDFTDGLIGNFEPGKKTDKLYEFQSSDAKSILETRKTRIGSDDRVIIDTVHHAGVAIKPLEKSDLITVSATNGDSFFDRDRNAAVEKENGERREKVVARNLFNNEPEEASNRLSDVVPLDDTTVGGYDGNIEVETDWNSFEFEQADHSIERVQFVTPKKVQLKSRNTVLDAEPIQTNLIARNSRATEILSHVPPKKWIIPPQYSGLIRAARRDKEIVDSILDSDSEVVELLNRSSELQSSIRFSHDRTRFYRPLSPVKRPAAMHHHRTGRRHHHRSRSLEKVFENLGTANNVLATSSSRAKIIVDRILRDGEMYELVSTADSEYDDDRSLVTRSRSEHSFSDTLSLTTISRSVSEISLSTNDGGEYRAHTEVATRKKMTNRKSSTPIVLNKKKNEKVCASCKKNSAKTRRLPPRSENDTTSNADRSKRTDVVVSELEKRFQNLFPANVKSDANGSCPDMKVIDSDSVETKPSQSVPTTADEKRQSKRADSIFETEILDGLNPDPAVLHRIRLIELVRIDDDCERRHDYIMKVRLFRHWLSYVKKQQQKKERHQRADDFHRRRLERFHFKRWKSSLISLEQEQCADSLRRCHLLVRGLRAFKQSVWMSKLENSIRLQEKRRRSASRYFYLWHGKTVARRRRLAEKFFNKWRKFVQRAKRKRSLNEKRTFFVTKKAFIHWKESYNDKQRMNIASIHHRLMELYKYLMIWRVYSSGRQLYYQNQEIARLQSESKTMDKAFRQMKTAVRNNRIAQAHYRNKLMLCTVTEWHNSCKISRARDQQLGATVVQLRRRHLLHFGLNLWRKRYREKQADRFRQSRTVRVYFVRWGQRISEREDFRAQICAIRVIDQWRRYVRIREQERHKATRIIQTSWLRFLLLKWKAKTVEISNLKKQVRNLRQGWVHRRMRLAWFTWLVKYERVHYTRLSRNQWSMYCVRKAAKHWLRVTRWKKLEVLHERARVMREQTYIRVSFTKWKTATVENRWNLRRADDLNKRQSQRRLRRMLDAWFIYTKQSRTIQSLHTRVRCTILTKAFDGWRSRAALKKDHDQKLNRRQLETQRKTFNSWRLELQKQKIAGDFEQLVFNRRAVDIFRSWKYVVQRRKIAQQFNIRRLLRLCVNVWKMEYEMRIDRKEMRIGNQLRKHVTKKACMKIWKLTTDRQVLVQEIITTRLDEKRKVRYLKVYMQNWKCALRNQHTASKFQEKKTVNHLRHVLRHWHELSRREMNDSVCHLKSRINAEERKIIGENQNSSCRRDSAITVRKISAGSLNSDSSGFNTINAQSLSVSSCSSDESEDIFLTPESSPPRNDDQRLPQQTMVQSRERNWKTVMLNAITRWKYWPVSAAFQQWKQFTRVSKVARAVTRSLVSRRSEKLVSDVFYSWKYQTQLSIRARQHRVCSLLNPAIETWKQFSELHHRKSHDKRLARDFYSSRLTRVHFKAWKLRTTERFDAEARVLSSTKPLTTRDVDVMKWKVETFRRRKNERNLTESFLVWKEEYYKLHLAKRHCNRISLRRCFYAWLNCYDSYKYLESDLIRRSESHQLKRFFGEWYERTETVRMAANFHRCNEIQKLRPILQSWKLWSSGRRDERERMFRLREASRRRTIGTVFTLWRNKIQVIQLGDKYFSIGLIDRCFHDWLNLTRKRKHDRKLFDDFRTLQRKRKLRLAFSFWRKQHKLKLEVQHWKIEQRNRLVRSVGRRWKENAENRQIRREYERTIQRQVVEHWSAFVRSRLKVSCTVQRVACRWLEYTQHSRHLETLADDFCRIKSAIRLNKAFTKWKQHFHKYQVSELMYEDRLQKRVFKGWLRIIRHQKNLTLSLVAFQRKKTRQLLHTTFSVWRSEFRLLRLREEIVNDHIDKHDLNLLRQVINEWHSFTKQSKQERRILSRILEAWNIFVNGQKLRNDLMNRFVSNRLVESTFNSWNKSAERMNRAKEHHEKIVQSRVLKAWLNIVQRKQLLKNLTAQQQKTALSSAWLRWKIVFQRDRRYNELAAKLRQHHSQEVLLHYFESWLQQTYIVLLSKEQNRRSLQTSFTHWKSRVNPAQITHDREQSWGVFARQLRSDKQIQIDNIRKAVGHYQTKLCKWAFNVWQSNCNSERRRNELAFKYGLRWWRLATGPGKVYEKRRVRLMKWAWCKWRKQVIRERVSRQFYRRGQLSLLSKVFNVWRQSATTSETSRSRAQISLISSSESELAAALERMRSEMKFDAPTIFVQSASSIEDGAESPDLLDRSIESDDF